MDFEKKVSICMMIKNEEQNLHRCLKSLQPVIEAGLAELIIVDTGSEDNSVEIAKQYTDKVYYHPWTNNFSEMRNISISYARGEWIWIIDADEEVVNPEEMISLFNKDLSRYNTIIVTVRNYLSTPGQGKTVNYCSSVSERGFRNSKDFKYVGAVHNQPLSKKPSLMTEILLDHYGYIWEDKEFARKKFERTASILQKELEKNPENIYYQFQLAVSWANIDKKQSLKEIRKAYKLIKKLPAKNRVYHTYIYNVYARIANMNECYLETIAICKEGLTYSKDNIDLWFAGGYAYHKIKDIENAIKFFNSYIELFDRFKKTNIAQSPAFTFYHADDLSKKYAFYYLGLLELEKENYDQVLKYTANLEASDIKSDIILKLSMNVNPNYDILIEYFDELMSNNEYEIVKNELINKLEKNYCLENKYLDLYQKIVDYYTNRDPKDPYYFLNLIRLALIKKSPVIDKNCREELLNLPYQDLPEYYGDILFYIVKENFDLKEFTKLGYDEHINNLLQYAMTKYPDFYKTVQQYLYNNEPNEDIEKLRCWILLARHVLLSEKLEIPEYMNLFKKYVNLGINYIQKIYHPAVLKEEMINNVKNDEHRFFVYMLKAQTVKGKDKKTYIYYLRKALKVYPMKTGIEQLLKEVQREISSIENEMSLLKLQFKNNIKTLINFNRLEEAEKLIHEYEKIVPEEDTEILLIKSELILRKTEKAVLNN